MNVDNLTIGEAKEIASMFRTKEHKGLSSMIGKKCIVRTYSAGVHFGEVVEKEGTEVILKDARRLWYWKAKQSISLSAVVKYGLGDESRIAPSVSKIWLDAIELIPVTDAIAENIEGQPDAVAR